MEKHSHSHEEQFEATAVRVSMVSIIVIIGVKISAKESDHEHPYGHERFECVAAVVLAVILFITGLFIGHSALEQITAGEERQLVIPGALALAAASRSRA